MFHVLSEVTFQQVEQLAGSARGGGGAEGWGQESSQRKNPEQGKYLLWINRWTKANVVLQNVTRRRVL